MERSFHQTVSMTEARVQPSDLDILQLWTPKPDEKLARVRQAVGYAVNSSASAIETSR